MIVIASSGLNLPHELIKHCQIEETPHQIVVDGTHHDVRSIASFSLIKQWVKTAKEPPYPLGSSASEYVTLLNELVKRTSEVAIITGTKKILRTYDAAVAAIRVLGSTRKGLDARVLDTGLVELGAGLVAAYCAAAAQAGHSMDAVLEAGKALADASLQICAPNSLAFLLKSGRADLAPGALPSASSSSPIIGMRDGELRNIGMIAANDSTSEKLVELLLSRYKPGSALWLTVSYSDDPQPARELLATVRKHFDVRYALLSHIGPVAYLFLGSKALILSAHPVEAMRLVVRLPEPR